MKTYDIDQLDKDVSVVVVSVEILVIYKHM